MTFGVYVHVPFCASRCDYCAFATWTDRHHLMTAYLEALATEARRAAAELDEVTSVFVGGGTPSQAPPGALVDVLGELPLAAGAEVTVECNPDDVDAAMFGVLRDGGVTRISLGVQSLVDHVLVALGRTHDPRRVALAVEAVREVGGLALNLDLIYGASTETTTDWRASLTGALALGPDHISAYALTVEAGTGLAEDPSRHPDDDDQADKYLIADELLAGAGLANYEISNWARPGQECRHSLLYWRMGEYLGLGCAAHSHRDGRRWWNVRTPERYVSAIAAGRSAEAAGERLDAGARRLEALQLSVRTIDGVPAGAVPDEVAHLVEVDDLGTARLTRDGRLLANEVAVRLS